MSDFDAEAQAMASVNTSNKVLEDMFAAATGVLESYAMQRDRLKVSKSDRVVSKLHGALDRGYTFFFLKQFICRLFVPVDGFLRLFEC